MPYSTDSLLSLGSATQCWTGVKQNGASAFLWLSGAYTPGGAASVGVVVVVVSAMSQGTAGKKEHAKSQGVELLTHSVECVKWTHRIITLHFLRLHNNKYTCSD